MTMVASGFECPLCGHEEADIERISLPQLELRCQRCGHRFAVEP